MGLSGGGEVNGSAVTLNDLLTLLTWQIGFGAPIDLDPTGAQAGQHISQIRGSWVTVSLTAATGTVTLTHNLNIPPTSVTGGGGTANLPNIRAIPMWKVYGDRTGATAAPAAPGGFEVDFLQMVNGTVTADAIDLLYSVNGFTPDATHPLQVTFFVLPAVV
jgi:hypothetical protein